MKSANRTLCIAHEAREANPESLWQRGRPKKIRFFGHFGAGNFGNESTVEAMLSNLLRLVPDVDVSCICSYPERVAAHYGIAAIPIRRTVVKLWNLRHPAAKLARKLVVGVPSEFYRWFDGIRKLRNTDAVVVVGTGLLTDAFSLGGWGPYSTFKWSLMAKLAGCKLFFVSVGAGPLTRAAGRFLIKSALALSDFRSYRDGATQRYLESIGFRREQDRVYPDLAFSLPADLLPQQYARKSHTPTVGLGLMSHSGMYGIEKATGADYARYQETLATFARWLLSRGYDIRLIIGDLADQPALDEFRFLLNKRLASGEIERVAAEPIASAKDLFEQLAETDLVVGTRFHNVLLALSFKIPSIAISFHPKCSALMDEMGIPEYCIDIKALNIEDLIQRFSSLEENAATIKGKIGKKVAENAKALDEQYQIIFNELLTD